MKLTAVMRDIVSPPFCAVCGVFLSERVHVCDWCRRGIIPPATCTMEINRTHQMKVYALSGYEGVVRKLILSKNYRSPIQMHQLGEILASTDFCPWDKFDLVVPVPLHWTRYTWRGFNQAVVLARAISNHRNLPLRIVVRRGKKTVQQTTLMHADRQKNVRDVFVLKRSLAHQIYGKRILLVDDVMTTGATIRALAHSILQAEPASITAVVAARVL